MSMLSPRETSLTVTHGGQEYTLVFDMETIARFEDATDLSIFEAMQGMNSGRPPKLTVLGMLLKASLAAHHPDVTRAEAMAMMINPQVQTLFAQAMASAMPDPDDTGEDTAQPAAGPTNRRARRAAKACAGKTSTSSP